MALFLLASPPGRLVTQEVPRPAPASYRYGKWAAAAVAAGFTALGVRAHSGANRSYDQLLDYCRTTPCRVGSGGRYTNADAETRYQQVVSGDRAARAWFVGGQVALAGAVTLFILELRHGPREPRNIPFSGPMLEVDRGATRLGWRLALRL